MNWTNRRLTHYGNAAPRLAIDLLVHWDRDSATFRVPEDVQVAIQHMATSEDEVATYSREYVSCAYEPYAVGA